VYELVLICRKEFISFFNNFALKVVIEKLDPSTR